MEQDISNLQKLWKEEKATPFDLNKLINQVNSIEKKGKLERIVLLIAVPITIVILVTMLPLLSNGYYLVSIILMSLGMLMILLQSFRSKNSLIKNEHELNNQNYIETLITKLKERMLTTSKYMWIYAFLLITGLNIGYIDILEKFNLPFSAKIITHLVLAGIMLYFFYYGISKRKKKNNTEILPLINLLENLKKG